MNAPQEFAPTPSANPLSTKINLARQPFESGFWVDMEAFFDFSFMISQELLDLEAIHALKYSKGARAGTAGDRR